MISKKHQLSRRFFLRGLGGTFMYLPVLEIMLNTNGTAYAQTGGSIEKKFVIIHCGQASGANNGSATIPMQIGANYERTIGLGPLFDEGVNNMTSIISNLSVRQISRLGGLDHIEGQIPQVCGVSQSTGKDGGITRVANAPSVDQILANNFGVMRNNVRSQGFVCCAQPVGHTTSSVSFGFQDRRQVQAELSPQNAWRSLFGNFAVGDGNRAELAALAAKNESILDLVKEDYQRLLGKVGTTDRQRLSDYMDLINDLQRSVAQVQEVSVLTCQKPNDPGADPGNMAFGNVSGNGRGITYRGENQRADVFVDLIHLALICGLENTASMVLTRPQSFVPAVPLIGNSPDGQNYDLHEAGHRNLKEYKSRAHAWHVQKFARLVKKLRDTRIGAGTALDNTIVTAYNESGGAGGEGPHSVDGLFSLIAGGSNFGIKLGQHIRTNRSEGALLFTTVLRAFGLEPRLGDVNNQVIGELLT